MGLGAGFRHKEKDKNKDAEKVAKKVVDQFKAHGHGGAAKATGSKA